MDNGFDATDVILTHENFKKKLKLPFIFFFYFKQKKKGTNEK